MRFILPYVWNLHNIRPELMQRSNINGNVSLGAETISEFIHFEFTSFLWKKVYSYFVISWQKIAQILHIIPI